MSTVDHWPKQAHPYTHAHLCMCTCMYTERHIQRHTYTDRHTHKGTHRDTYRDTHRDTQRHTHTEKHTQTYRQTHTMFANGEITPTQVRCCFVGGSVFSMHYIVQGLGKIKWEKPYNSPGTLLPKFCDYILSALCHRYHKLIKSFHA